MINWRLRIIYALWRMGLRQLLPVECVRSVIIEECGERMIPLECRERLILDDRLGVKHVGREGVVKALYRAAEALPRGYALRVIEVYRSPARQLDCWNKERRVLRMNYPYASEEAIDRMTRRIVADPTRGKPGGLQRQTKGEIRSRKA